MKIEVSIPFQSYIKFENDQIESVGSKSLLILLNDYKKLFGLDVQKWPLKVDVQNQNDILINELIRKVNGETFIYNHEELCHCRMVKTETVKNAVKAGCRTISDVSRTTLAGTGCGSCRADIEAVIKALTG